MILVLPIIDSGSLERSFSLERIISPIDNRLHITYYDGSANNSPAERVSIWSEAAGGLIILLVVVCCAPSLIPAAAEAAADVSSVGIGSEHCHVAAKFGLLFHYVARARGNSKYYRSSGQCPDLYRSRCVLAGSTRALNP